MVLTLDDISVFVANWNNKADNIRLIHKILNIGFDSMVFLDDNPFERNLVKESIPEITVPDLPEDPEKYLEYLYSLNLFETASFSNNDQDRTKQYQEEAKRVSSLPEYTNTDDFLKSLNMVSEVSSFTKFNTPRVAQLSQRSNQFNLRTIRYTEDQIIKIEKDTLQQGFAFTLSDKFGDNGLISVVILKDCDNSEESIPPNLHNMKSTLFIDSWFMSCRVLKRGVENYVLNTIVSWAKRNGYGYLIGEYIPTPKNGLVANLYSDMGFEAYVDPDNHCGTQWILNVDDYQERVCYIMTSQTGGTNDD